MELAVAHASTYAASASAPKHKGSVKPIDTWTLAELITVSRALNVLSEDVSKHADQVRNFRNYIHPASSSASGSSREWKQHASRTRCWLLPLPICRVSTSGDPRSHWAGRRHHRDRALHRQGRAPPSEGFCASCPTATW